MTAALKLRAFGAKAEARAVEEAARRLAGALAQDGLPAPEVSIEFAASPEALAGGAGGAITISSLLPEVEAALADWPATESRLTRVYEALASGDSQSLFLCTVFRHAPAELDDAARVELRRAIRRLDLLAIQLSHATGLNVIDLDRALAQVGAVSLGADFRLSGPAAAEAAGREIARCILAAGLDDLIAPEIQERAAAALAVS